MMQQVSGRYLSSSETLWARWLSAAGCSLTYRMLLYSSMPCAHSSASHGRCDSPQSGAYRASPSNQAGEAGPVSKCWGKLQTTLVAGDMVSRLENHGFQGAM